MSANKGAEPELKSKREKQCLQNIRHQWKLASEMSSENYSYDRAPFYVCDPVNKFTKGDPIERLEGKSVEEWIFEMACSKQIKKKKRDLAYQTKLNKKRKYI